MPTVLDCLNRAASKLGIKGAGKNLSPDDLDTIKQAANEFIDSMGAERQLSWTVQPFFYDLNVGQKIYPIGPTAPAPWTQPRPTTIQSWACIYPGSPPLLNIAKKKVLTADEYHSLALPDLPCPFPTDIYYDYGGGPADPNGKVYVYPVTNAGGYRLALYIPETLALFTDLKQDIFGFKTDGTASGSYPPGYYLFLVCGIAMHAAADFGRPIPADVAAIYSRGMAKLKARNIYVPPLSVQVRPRGGYDYMSDSFLEGGRR